MSAILIDSSVLLDIITPDSEWLEWSKEALTQASERYHMVINPIIYAEVSSRFATIEELDDALPGVPS